MDRLKWVVLVVTALFSSAFTLLAAAPDFNADIQQASAKIEAAMPGCAELMNAGDFAGANSKLLAVFPAADRTAGESFVLGNIFFDVDPRLSYALHEAAAKAEPQNPTVVWEWAMEQHRAGKYAGALAAYQLFSKARPQSAAPYALAADCLLRLNRVDAAIDAWQKSEAAPSGSIERMEDLVCSVHREPAPHARRAELLAKATQKGDADAAADLIALDCEFPKDWWNAGPHEAYLAHDLPAVIATLKLPPQDIRARTMQCAAECATANQDDGAAIKNIITKYRLLLDASQTIPTHGGLLAVILPRAVEAEAIDPATLHDKIDPKVLDLARKGHDPELWNLAAYAEAKGTPDEQIKLEREGWKATADPRFAAGVLFLKSQSGKLSGDDADLKAALKQFPESGMVQRAAFEVAVRENRLTRGLLAAAAMAEFSHFSTFVAPATVIARPRSNYLRQYFAQMAHMSVTQPAAQ